MRMKIIFALFLVQERVLKRGIMVRKANILTYILSFPKISKITENWFYDEKISF